MIENIQTTSILEVANKVNEIIDYLNVNRNVHEIKDNYEYLWETNRCKELGLRYKSLTHDGDFFEISTTSGRRYSSRNYGELGLYIALLSKLADVHTAL